MRELIEDFVNQRRVAIVGVTRNERGWGRRLYDEFRRRGYDTYAVNPARAIAGIQCYGSLRDVPRKLDGVILVVPPHVTEQVVREVAELGIRRVWMHRGIGCGAVSETAIGFCRENQIDVIYGVCPMMYLDRAGVGHRLHHALARWRQDLPEDA